MTIFLEYGRLGATWVRKLVNGHKSKVNGHKSKKSRFFLHDCNQMHYQIGFMGQFVRTICNSSYWYYTYATWSFIPKVVASGCINWLASNNRTTRVFSL